MLQLMTLHRRYKEARALACQKRALTRSLNHKYESLDLTKEALANSSQIRYNSNSSSIGLDTNSFL